MLLNVRLAHESCLASYRPSVGKPSEMANGAIVSEGGLGRVGSLGTRPKTSLAFFFAPLLPRRGLVWPGFVLLAERLEQDSDTRPLHHSNFYLDGHYYMLFAENSKIRLNSES